MNMQENILFSLAMPFLAVGRHGLVVEDDFLLNLEALVTVKHLGLITEINTW